MSDEKTVTWWSISPMTNELVEVDVPAEVDEAIARGEDVVLRSDWPQRRFNLGEAQGQERLERLEAEVQRRRHRD